MNEKMIIRLDNALDFDHWIDCDEVLQIAKENGGRLEFQVKGTVRYEPRDGHNAVRLYRLTVVD